MGTRKRLQHLLRPLTALAGLTGAVALVNRTLRETNLPHDYIGGTRLPWTWRGHEIFLTELGSGPPVLLVHGVYAGASSFEFRKLAPLLARSHRVLVVDLLGCGLSAMPDLHYCAELYVDQIVDLITTFTNEQVLCVGSSLGAAFSIEAAARAADHVAKLVGICPTGLGGILDEEPSAAQRALTPLLRAAMIGESLFNAIASTASIRRFLQNDVYADKTRVTKEIVDHYHVVSHRLGARFVPAHFIGGLLNCNVARDLPFVAAPLLVLWGEQASRTNPMNRAAEYIRLAKNARLLTFPDCGLLPHEEDPEGTASAIEAFWLESA